MLRPGSDPKAIRLALAAAAPLTQTAAGVGPAALAADGGLTVSSAVAAVSLGRPHSYQVISGQRRDVATSYQLISGSAGSQTTAELSFDVGAYDSSTTMVIDPTIIWKIYPKPPGIIGDDSEGKAVAVATDGNVWVAGWQWSGSSGTSNSHTAYLATRDPNGNVLAQGRFGGYSCSVVGNPYGDEVFGMVADTSGGVWVVGWTSCSDFPTVNPYRPPLSRGTVTPLLRILLRVRHPSFPPPILAERPRKSPTELASTRAPATSKKRGEPGLQGFLSSAGTAATGEAPMMPF